MTARFEGEVVVRWLVQQQPDRNMQLVEPFAFIDENDVYWNVPSGATINGASIPQLFWTTFGSPFVGNYRRASVVHDYHSKVRVRPSQQVHRMFFDASRTGGVGLITALKMYFAIRTFGPNWTLMQQGTGEETTAMPFARMMSPEDAHRLMYEIESKPSSPDEIDRMIDQNAECIDYGATSSS